MQAQKKSVGGLSFLLSNLPKLLLLGLLIYIAFKKELNIEVHFSTPRKLEAPSRQVLPVEAPPPEKMTREAVEDAEAGGLGGGDAWGRLLGSRGAVLSAAALNGVDEAQKIAYLKRFVEVARSERRKYGIPTSIILANAMLHSAAGTQPWARQGNNQFALPCTPDWPGAKGDYAPGCLRHYDNAWMSFRDHSLYLTSGRFAQLLALGTTDYRAWAEGLERLGFSSLPHLKENLVGIIEQYGLSEFDE
ncbi:MAG: hypothetical protein D6765_02145 [Bacteroidetes bacterium]|nr:MAG: hypothetical protein D6765_02145 [Bacteroidota bacterium]